MQDRKSQQRKTEDRKAERLAEALRANLGKRKALARAKKAKAAESPNDAFEMPHGAGTDDEDANASS
jgi:hypothetical protein